MTVAQGYTTVKTVWENISKMFGGKVFKQPIPSPILHKQHLPDPFFLEISENNNCQLHTGKTT